jgi:hypothetical protein
MSASASTLPNMRWDDDEPLEELGAAGDAQELCRRLLASPSGWGSSTRHAEAIELLSNVQGTGELPMSFVAMMLCTCRRWDRATSRLIAAVEASGLLDDSELDELARSFLCHEHVISYPLTWASPQWLEVELDGRNGRTYTVNEATLAERRLSFEPPLRRWAARRALRSDPARLEDLLHAAELLQPRHHGALIHGLLDAADVLDEPHRRDLIARGLKAAQASVRRTALDRLCELDGHEKARRRAQRDPNAAVRKWRPHTLDFSQPTLLEA